MAYKYIQDVPQPPRRIRFSRAGRLIVTGLGILTALQLVAALGALAQRHQAGPLIYFAVDFVLWGVLLGYFYRREAALLRGGVATNASITAVTGNRVDYRFHVGAVTYPGYRHVALASTAGIRPGMQVGIVYDPADPRKNLPITAAALIEIAE